MTELCPQGFQYLSDSLFASDWSVEGFKTVFITIKGSYYVAVERVVKEVLETCFLCGLRAVTCRLQISVFLYKKEMHYP